MEKIKLNLALESEAGLLYKRYCEENNIECRITAAANFCLGYMVVKEQQPGMSLPAADAVQNWFEENIDKDCSASSAVYKFRLWLESLQVVRQVGAVWVKASERLPNNPGDPLNHFRLHGRKVNGNFYQDSDGMMFFEVRGSTHEPYQIGWKSFQYLEWLDESGAPAAAREEDAVAIFEELWDEHAEYIDDDIDSLSRWAGSTVVDKEQFKALLAQLWEAIKKQKENP